MKVEILSLSLPVCHCFNISNLNLLKYIFQRIYFFTQVSGQCHSSSTMKFSLIIISVGMAFTSIPVSGLSCAFGTELECVTETKCELTERGGRCFPQQVCDCVQKFFGPPTRSRGFLPNFRPGGENFFCDDNDRSN